MSEKLNCESLTCQALAVKLLKKIDTPEWKVNIVFENIAEEDGNKYSSRPLVLESSRINLFLH